MQSSRGNCVVDDVDNAQYGRYAKRVISVQRVQRSELYYNGIDEVDVRRDGWDTLRSVPGTIRQAADHPRKNPRLGNRLFTCPHPSQTSRRSGTIGRVTVPMPLC